MRTRLVVLALLVWVFGAAGAARADGLPETDRAAIQAVISGQLDAFRRDDGATAFGYASPGIHEMFGTVDTFMTMVQRGYPPVYRPRQVTFGQLVEEDGRIVQVVHLVGPDGAPVDAFYTMEKQPDGSWKIAGCRLAEPGVSV